MGGQNGCMLLHLPLTVIIASVENNAVDAVLALHLYHPASPLFRLDIDRVLPVWLAIWIPSLNLERNNKNIL